MGIFGMFLNNAEKEAREEQRRLDKIPSERRILIYHRPDALNIAEAIALLEERGYPELEELQSEFQKRYKINEDFDELEALKQRVNYLRDFSDAQVRLEKLRSLPDMAQYREVYDELKERLDELGSAALWVPALSDTLRTEINQKLYEIFLGRFSKAAGDRLAPLVGLVGGVPLIARKPGSSVKQEIADSVIFADTVPTDADEVSKALIRGVIDLEKKESQNKGSIKRPELQEIRERTLGEMLSQLTIGGALQAYAQEYGRKANVSGRQGAGEPTIDVDD